MTNIVPLCRVKTTPAATTRAAEIYEVLVGEYHLTATHERLLARMAADALAASEQLAAALAKNRAPGVLTTEGGSRLDPALKAMAIYAPIAMWALDKLELKTRMRTRVDPGGNIGVGGNKSHRHRTFADVS